LKSILLINHYAGSPVHGMEYRPYYLARAWVKNGYKVKIVAASVSHVRSVQPEIEGEYREETIDGIEYLWFKTPAYSSNGAKRFVNMLAFIRQLNKLSNKIVQEVRPDVVIASSTYPLDIYPAAKIAKKSHAKLIFEVHDLWPLSPMELGGMSKWHPFIMIMQMAENYAYKNSDLVVSMLPNALAHMESHGLVKERYSCIPNGIAVDEWKKDSEQLPEELDQIISRKKEKGYFLVGYAGAHGVANALDNVLEAALLLRGQKVMFVLIGHGPEKERLIKAAKEKNIVNVIFQPSIPKELIPSFLNKMDALYIGLQKQPLFRYGISPNKLMDYMMAKKPIIQAIEAGNDMVSDAGCGISIEAENPEALKNAVELLMSKGHAELEGMGDSGYQYVTRNHDYRVLAQNFAELID